ncbi:MAG: DUF402 domain-containing protein, partial [Candidatus Bathyarchaeota archaeon]|nr:DUF402 domain-containing protein [Candidatus Bathyarchaeota archaeon]
MFKVKVRGIYSTALTRILLENGFKIVQPSATIRERFKLTPSPDDCSQPDLEINDRFDKQGVHVTGDSAAAEKFISVLLNFLDDVIIRRRLPSMPIHLNDSISLENLSDILTEVNSLTPHQIVNVDVEFPGISKRRLDEIRSKVAPTLNGHHYYKVYGGKAAAMVEMAEKMLERGYPAKDIEDLFRECVLREYPYKGSKLNIEHVKISGRVFHLGEAKIAEFNEEDQRIILLRVFSTQGVYDGLKVLKEIGDYAITKMKINGLYFQTSYFSRDGEYKGTYVNINTPIEIYPGKIRYVDLEVDV